MPWLRNRLLSQCAGVALGLASLQVASDLGLLAAVLIPSPRAVLRALPTLLSEPDSRSALGNTLSVWLLVAAAGSIAAVVLASGLSRASWIEGLLTPWTGFLRALPPIALFPVGLLLFGHGTRTIFLVAALCLALILLPILRASIRASSERYEDLIKILGLTRRQRLLVVILPSMIVELAGVARSTLTLALALTIAGEILIGGSRTVGRLFVESLELYRLEVAFALLSLVGLAGMGSDAIGEVLEGSIQEGGRSDG